MLVGLIPACAASTFDRPIAGGHLHDYGVELRLEDVEAGEALVRLESKRTPDGKVLEVEQKILRRFFKLLDARIRMEAGRKYRLVGIFENPTRETIPAGGMAHMVGLFAPDDASAWPEINESRPEYVKDVANLPVLFDGPMESARRVQ